MAVSLAASLASPSCSKSPLQAAEEALLHLEGYEIFPPTPAAAIFNAPYSATLAALPPSALLALLCLPQLHALPAPATEFLTASLAQRYASLPSAQFEAEVGMPCPLWGCRVQGWWWGRFGTLPASWREPPLPQCFCAEVVEPSSSVRVVEPSSSANLLPVLAFGLLPGAPPAEYWARGLVCPDTLQAAPTCSALLAQTMGHAAWLQGFWPEAGAAAVSVAATRQLDSPSASYTALVALLSGQGGAGAPVLAHNCCMQLWERAGDCPPSEVGQAVAALAGALRTHPADGCITQCACAALVRLVRPSSGLGAALLATLPALVAVLCCAALPPAATYQASYCLSTVMEHPQPTLLASVLPVSLVGRLVELLQWRSWPCLQLTASQVLGRLECGATDPAVLAAIHKGEALPPLVRMLDSPLAIARLYAVLLLGKYARDWPGAASALLRADALPTLLRALHPHAEVLFVRQASKAIRHLLSPLPAVGTARALLPRLAALLTASDADTLESAAQAICLVCCTGGEEWQQAVLEAGCLTPLLALLRHPGQLPLHVLRTLDSLAQGGGLRLQSVLNAGALQGAAALLRRRGQTRDHHKAACTLLARACGGSQGQVQVALQAGSVQALVTAASRGGRAGQGSLVLEAGWGLACIARGGSRLQALQVVEGGGLAVLASCLAMSRRAEGEQGMERVAAVLEGVDALLSKGAAAALLREAGVGQAVQGMPGMWRMLVEARRVMQRLEE